MDPGGLVNHVMVSFRVPSAGGFVKLESIWALPVGAGQYEIDRVPFFARSISRHDVVYAEPDYGNQGQLAFKSIARRGGHSTMRVRLGDDMRAESPTVRFKLLQIRKIGCAVEYGEMLDERLIAIDVPPAVDIWLVRASVEDGTAMKLWTHEEAHVAI